MSLLSGKQAGNVIVQKRMVAEKVELSSIGLSKGDISCGEYSVRFGLFIGPQGEILDLGLTASEGEIAHGGTKSINLSYTA